MSNVNKEKGRRIARFVLPITVGIAIGLIGLAVYQRWYLYRYPLIMLPCMAFISAPVFFYMLAAAFCYILKRERLGMACLDIVDGYIEQLGEPLF